MSKTLMSYPCPYYVLVLFYILISTLLLDIFFLDLVCIQVNRVAFRSFLEMQRRRGEDLIRATVG